MTEYAAALQADSPKFYQRLSGSTLKIIAMVSMLIDHAALTLLFAYVAYTPMEAEEWEICNTIYTLMRSIGRTAFPIFCFLLCEGFFYTRSRTKQAARLLLFAALSEIPFDLVSAGTFSWSMQNVFFTLLIGYLVIWGMEESRDRLKSLHMAACIFIWIAGVVLAELLHTDYGGKGIILIVILYLFCYNRVAAGIVGYLSMLWEPWCFPAFLLIQGYNGKRGLPLKYVFYLFYPLHLLLLYLLTRLMWA